jgi:hypothetical protein
LVVVDTEATVNKKVDMAFAATKKAFETGKTRPYAFRIK